MNLIKSGYCDEAVRTLVENNPSMAVPWYLSAGLAYYAWDENIMHDATYDWLCDVLSTHWDVIEHRHKSIIQRDPESGKVASGFSLKFDDFPLIILGSAKNLMNQCIKERIAVGLRNKSRSYIGAK